MGSFPSSFFFVRAESAVFLRLGWMQLPIVGFEFATGERGEWISVDEKLGGDS